MLILPLQHKLSWKQPPILTIALIVINCAIFLFYQSGDTDKYPIIADQYKQTGLLYSEAPHYGTYLGRRMLNDPNIQAEDIAYIEKQIANKQYDDVIYAMMTDQQFVEYLGHSASLIWNEKDAAWWAETRVAFYQEQLKSISAMAYGYIPNETKFTALLSHQFLHGSLAHLGGNMVILFILMFGLERIIGRAKLLLVYLLSGVTGALLFGAIDTGGYTPLVGASGSISGLMGLYAGVFATQKIRFFYFIIFAFGYLRAPALILLPIWVGNEVYQYLSFPDSPVAYFAHVGGLLFGGLTGWGLKNSWLQKKEDTVELEEQSESLFRKQYAQSLASMESLQFQQARNQLLALWKKHPDKIFLLEHLFHLYKMLPATKQYHMIYLQWMQVSQFDEDFWLATKEYLKNERHFSLLKADNQARLLEAAIDHDQVNILEQLLSVLEKRSDKTQLIQVLDHLQRYYRLNAQAAKAQAYELQLQGLVPNN